VPTALIRRVSSWLPLAAVTALALIVRVAYQAELAGSPLLSGLMGDSRVYDAWAQQIANGRWLGTEVFYQTPLYPYGLAIIFKAAGHDLGVVRLIQAILGAASCALLGLAGRRFFSTGAGLIAALLLAVYPSAFFFDGLIQKSSLDIFFITLLLALLGEFGARREWKWLVGLGVTAAAFTLNRENARVLYPVFAVWLWFAFREVPGRRRVAWMAAFTAATLAVLLPVGVRNYRVGGEFLISTSQLGPNFYIGNHPRASGTYEPLVPGRGDPAFERDDATRLASKAAGRALSAGEVSDYWLAQSFAYIRDQPFRWMASLGRKLLLTLNAVELPDTESIAAYADYSPILRGLRWLNLGVVLPLAAYGAWVHRSRWRRLIVLYAMFAGLALSVAIFYVVARYRHPLVPIVLLFSGAGVSGLLDMRLRRSRPADAQAKRAPGPPPSRGRSGEPGERRTPAGRRQWLPGLAIAGVVAIVANLPIDAARDETYLNLGVLLAQNRRPSDAIPALQKAVARDPEYAEPHFRLGLAYQDAGRPQAAIEELTIAVRLRPDHGDAHGALGILLRDQNRTAEALLHFREAVTQAPGSADSHSNLGLALMEAGQSTEAIAEFRRALALAPDRPNPHNNLALALASARRFDEALPHFREAIRLEPANYELRINLASALSAAGKDAESLEQYEAAARLAREAGRSDIAQAIIDGVRRMTQRRDP